MKPSTSASSFSTRASSSESLLNSAALSGNESLLKQLVAPNSKLKRRQHTEQEKPVPDSASDDEGVWATLMERTTAARHVVLGAAFASALAWLGKRYHRRFLQTAAAALPYNSHIIAIAAPFLAFFQLRLRRASEDYTTRSAVADWALWILANFGTTIFGALVLHSLTSLRNAKSSARSRIVATCVSWCSPLALLQYFRMKRPISFIPAAVLSGLFYLYKSTYAGAPESTGRRENMSEDKDSFLRKQFLQLYQEYFSLNVVNVSGQTLNPTKPRIIGYHPHGIVAFSGLFLSSLPAFQAHFPGVKTHAMSHMAMHVVPLMRDLLQFWGAREASQDNFRSLLQNNKSILLIPGGAAEMPFAKEGNELVLVTKHKGFVREALTCGASLVPCLCLAEHELFDQLSGGVLGKVQSCSHKVFGFPFPFIPVGKMGIPGFIPKRKHLTVLVGPEIDFQIKGDKPTADEINTVHSRYFASMRQMFDEHAVSQGFGHYKLVFQEERASQHADTSKL